MPTRRQQQVADAIQKEISVLIQRELKDPRLGFVTVTRAEVSPDLHYARVFVSVLGTPEEQAASLKALESASGFLRRELGTRLTMRYVPALQFRADASIAHSDRIARLLNELAADDGALPPAPDDPAAASPAEAADTQEHA
jgi:ribosome-binding factor A